MTQREGLPRPVQRERDSVQTKRPNAEDGHSREPRLVFLGDDDDAAIRLEASGRPFGRLPVSDAHQVQVKRVGFEQNAVHKEVVMDFEISNFRNPSAR